MKQIVRNTHVKMTVTPVILTKEAAETIVIAIASVMMRLVHR